MQYCATISSAILLDIPYGLPSPAADPVDASIKFWVLIFLSTFNVPNTFQGSFNNTYKGLRDNTDIGIDKNLFGELYEKIINLSNNEVRKIRVTKFNIMKAYEKFDEGVLGKKDSTIKILTTNEKANLFVQIIVNPMDNYLHPKKKNILIN